MNSENEKIVWSGIRGFGEFIIGIVSVYIAISFFSNASKSDFSTATAIQSFVFFIILTTYFFCFGFYHLFVFLGLLKIKYMYQSNSRLSRIEWKEIGGIALGIFLIIVGLLIVYSGVMDIWHFFKCSDFCNFKYLKSAVPSIAPICAICLGLFNMFLGILYLVRKGDL